MNIQSLKDKIDDLNEKAWNARVNDSPKAFELSQESVKLARSINYSKGLAQGLRSLGFCYVRLFKNDEALTLLQESLSLFQSIDDIEGQGIVYEYLGIIQRNWGNLGASLDLLLKGHRIILQSGNLEILCTSCYQIGVTYKHLGNHENALDYLFECLSVSKSINFELMEAYAINIIGSIYFDNGDYKHALDYYQQGLVTRRAANDKWGEAGSLDNIGFTHLKLKDYKQAIDYCRQSLEICKSTDDKKGQSNALLHLAEIYKESGDLLQASAFCDESLEIRRARGDKRGEAEVLLFMADLHAGEKGKDDEISGWLSNALKISEEIKAQDLFSKAHYYLYEYHRRKTNFERSLVHVEAHLQMEKELHRNAITQKVLNLEISYKAEEAKKEAEAVRRRNEELTALNTEIEEQKKRLEQALVELKATQAQLIHAEKMASLGELTAGIAHEIQNPLNFVNNFSEINRELIEELKSEKSKMKGERNENLENQLLSDIELNLEKINHHGRRADAIVKGMLQHSRSSTGQKEPTDINALADEFLRLAYHGVRAKDKSFNAKFETHFDATISKIDIVPQEIGRVILNLINNAFYAVSEKQKKNPANYLPTVVLSTAKHNARPPARAGTDGDDPVGRGIIEIKVKDNGNGIPQNLVDKIFQPFFTTKPTGQGTGLGLSLAYDIVTKGHGGELKVSTKEGKGSEFIVLLPAN